MLRLLLAAVLVLLLAAPAADAATTAEIIRDCNQDGRLDGNYTASEIRRARNNIPDDVDQYSDCRDVLTRALGGTGTKAVPSGPGGGAGGAGGGGGAGGAPLTPASPAEQQALDTARRSAGDSPVQLTTGAIRPGAGGLANVSNTLPPSLLGVLILLGVAALAAAVPFVRRRVHARRTA